MITIQSEPVVIDKKLAAVINEKCDPGVAMNALAHMSLGMGAALGADKALMCDYTDADNISHPYISAYPFIILQGRPNKIREAIDAARSAGVQCVNFTNTMTEGSYADQLQRTKSTSSADLQFYGAVFYGETAAVNEITKKFSLFR